MLKYLLLTSFLLANGLVCAMSDKQLDNFSSLVSFYTSGTAASITPSVDNTQYIEGSSALKISYNLNGVAGNYVEVFRNYNTSTLDLSFSPDVLSIKVLGAAGNTDIFKFMLYEDQNMNGNPFDSGDEIYEFTSSSVLSSTAWTTLNMPYASFSKFGGGAGTLDLNRIGAWRIYITNSGSSSSHIAYIDDLRQHTTYTAPSTGSPTLDGSFIQLWNTAGCNCGQWTQLQWDQQLQYMKDACISKLVIQYGVYTDNAWYSPSSLGYVTYTNPTLSRILTAADAKGIDIYLGLYFDETWNSSDKSQATTYSAILSKHQQVIDEMWGLFSGHTSLKGWYIPQEINDLEWQSTVKRDLLAGFLQSTASYAKGKDNSKKVLIAPFFGPNRPADDLQSWWENVLTTASDIDILYVQDGVGTTTKDVDTDVPHYFAAIRQACINKGKILGATVETFQQTDGWPINGNSFAAVPAAMNRLAGQLREADKHAAELIQFEWAYMQPALTAATQVLYDDYKTYSGCNTTPVSSAVSGGISKGIYPNPCNGTFSVNTEEEVQVEIYNDLGILITQARATADSKITLPDGMAGLFTVKILHENSSEVFLLICE